MLNSKENIFTDILKKLEKKHQLDKFMIDFLTSYSSDREEQARRGKNVDYGNNDVQQIEKRFKEKLLQSLKKLYTDNLKNDNLTNVITRSIIENIEKGGDFWKLFLNQTTINKMIKEDLQNKIIWKEINTSFNNSNKKLNSIFSDYLKNTILMKFKCYALHYFENKFLQTDEKVQNFFKAYKEYLDKQNCNNGLSIEQQKKVGNVLSNKRKYTITHSGLVCSFFIKNPDYLNKITNIDFAGLKTALNSND